MTAYAVIDGVSSEDPEGSVQFHEATHLTASDWDQLRQTVRGHGGEEPMMPFEMALRRRT